MAQKVVSYVRLMTALPSTVVDRIVESWARTLKAEAESIYEKLTSRIPDAKRFQEVLVGASSQGFLPYINPAFISRSGKGERVIKSGQIANLKRSFERYRKKLGWIFESVDGIPAKRYKELVDLKKDDFRAGLASRTIAFTGTKIEGLGPASIAVLWLVKDLTVEGKLRPGDDMKGGPFLITLREDVPNLKATLQSRLGQAGANIVKADYAEPVMQAENDHTNRIVQKFVDPALNIVSFATGGASHVDYLLSEATQLFLEIKITVTT